MFGALRTVRGTSHCNSSQSSVEGNQEVVSIVTRKKSSLYGNDYLTTFIDYRRPYPLTTVELQKAGTRFLRMSSQKIMTVNLSLKVQPHHRPVRRLFDRTL